ncbi:unnamed protein product [Mycena citricolor]|uniref:TLC domain-containing protein n=1 Tax=Mycena citricolor TaxID=2018698 RepID=A0AAD2GWZ7_9AGAR|nr:unnamed protein product [Mycena citricolor]
MSTKYLRLTEIRLNGAFPQNTASIKAAQGHKGSTLMTETASRSLPLEPDLGPTRCVQRRRASHVLLTLVMDFFDLDRTFPKLRPHLPVFLASYALFNVIHLFLVPLIGNLLFPAQWNKMNRRARNNWAIHVCSQAHALIIVPLALRRLQLPELDANRAFGWNEQSGTLQAIAVAYFLWDAIDAIYNFESVGFVLHGVACTAIYLCAFKPFLAYYAARCLLWETSTIFLNNHWRFSHLAVLTEVMTLRRALDKMNRTGGTMQLLNGVFLISSFFLSG